MVDNRKLIPVMLGAILIALGTLFKPSGATFGRDMRIADLSGPNQALVIAKQGSDRYHLLRRLLAVSYALDSYRVDDPDKYTRVCKEVSLVSVYTLYALPIGHYWVGCGGAEGGYV